MQLRKLDNDVYALLDAGRPPVVGDLVMRRGAREIHVRHLGSEVVVWLPAERILAGGTLGLLRAA